MTLKLNFTLKSLFLLYWNFVIIYVKTGKAGRCCMKGHTYSPLSFAPLRIPPLYWRKEGDVSDINAFTPLLCDSREGVGG